MIIKGTPAINVGLGQMNIREIIESS